MATPVVTDRSERDRRREIELSEYLGFLWKWRLFIVGLSSLAAALAVAFGAQEPRQYSASTELQIGVPKLGTGRSPSVPSVPQDLTSLWYVRNRTSAAEVLNEFDLDAAPYNLSVTSFLEAALGVEAIPDTLLVEVTVTLPDPDVARDVVNRVAELAVELSTEMSQQDIVTSRDVLREEVERARQAQTEIEVELTAFSLDAKPEIAEQAYEQMLSGRRTLQDLEIRIQTEAAFAEVTERQLAEQEKLVTVKRTIDSESLLLESVRASGVDNLAGIIGLQLESEFMNPTYQVLEQGLAASRSRLAAMERQAEILRERLGTDSEQVQKVAAYHEIDRRHADLEHRYTASQELYGQFFVQYELARVDVASQTAQLKVVNPALDPGRSSGRGLLRRAILAAIAAFAATASLAVFVEYFQRQVLQRQ